ncbi:MAG TPA: 1-deoxy-D-xylulose-5-phosphate reductoisomerase [Syntrophomonas sp.]|jgi:1-deoxy-D-xylulose-5-phosphate reductoisomerase|nr:1-deoxy-D-xylulose-5-phosphate reductoisomerase [Syntrophomonas sp.]
MRSDGKTGVVVLGSTGSIGRQALDVIDKYRDRFSLLGIAAYNEAALLQEQIAKFQPRMVNVTDQRAYMALKAGLPAGTGLSLGMEAMCELAAWPEADIVLVAVSGAIGIEPTLTAIAAGKRVALANKETLVAAGDLVMHRAAREGVMILPVDSEHSAIFQCLAGEEAHLHKIWLTASGGPFRGYSPQQMRNVTVAMTLKHPTWMMGPKITVDSATLMNKGLEVIEAHHLFKVDYDSIEVVVHRESVVHSLVEFTDGSFLGHLGPHDMRIPIQYALTYPERMESPAVGLDLTALGALHFEKPDRASFPALDLAYQAGKAGGTMPAVMNAANEVAVSAFLAQQLSFMGIVDVVTAVMEKQHQKAASDLETILAADRWARKESEMIIQQLAAKRV